MKKILKWAGIAIIALIVIGMLVPSEDTANDPTPAVATISYEAELTNGHFKAGIDFPAGKYDIEAIKGGGNVSSDNMFSGGINAVMGTEEADSNMNIYEQKYSNIDLPKGTVLSVDKVTIKITSDKASGESLTERKEYPDEKLTLSNGNFTAGDDFPTGTYNIVAVKGGGNVSSDNLLEGGINAIIGTESANTGLGIYEQKYFNIKLETGSILSIDGVTIDLIPVKIEE